MAHIKKMITKLENNEELHISLFTVEEDTLRVKAQFMHKGKRTVLIKDFPTDTVTKTMVTLEIEQLIHFINNTINMEEARDSN